MCDLIVCASELVNEWVMVMGGSEMSECVCESELW